MLLGPRCGMAFEDDLKFNMVINKDIAPMQCLSRSKARMEVDLITKVRRDLGLDEMDLSINLEYLEVSPLDCKNNHVGSESESHKNRGKKGYK